MSMTGTIDRVEVITSVQWRRRWPAEEKVRMVQETYAPGMSVSLVARQHGVAPNRLFTWRRLYAEGALLAVLVRHGCERQRFLHTAKSIFLIASILSLIMLIEIRDET